MAKYYENNSDWHTRLKTLGELYKEFKAWQKKQTEVYVITFNTDPVPWGDHHPLNRHIVSHGILTGRFFDAVEIFFISGKEWIYNGIECKNAKEARETRNRLNAYWVRDHEPDMAKMPGWKEQIAKYCKAS